MDQLIPAPPEAVRVWRGFKSSEIDWFSFLKQLGDMFIPVTAQIQAPLGMTAYLPAVLPVEKPDGVPDEIALVFYRSQKAYRQTFKTVGGRTYSRLHSTVFSRQRSRSGFPRYFESDVSLNSPYCLFSNETDWCHGRSKVFVGVRHHGQSTAAFTDGIREIFRTELQNRSSCIDGAYFIVTENYLIYWQHWSGVGDVEQEKTMDLLADLAQPVLVEEAVKVNIPSRLSVEYEGITVQAGKYYCIQFERG